MTSTDKYKQSIRELQEEINSTEPCERDSKFWNEKGAQLLILIDRVITEAHCANALMPKSSSGEMLALESGSILSLMFVILCGMSNVNSPFVHPSWIAHWNCSADKLNFNKLISFYELAMIQMISFISVLLGDKLGNVQKILIKFLFSTNNTVCSLFASDLLAFILRVLPPRQSNSLCLIIMNLCKLAPQDSLVHGAAFLKRAKHPTINFENPNYQFVLDLQ